MKKLCRMLYKKYHIPLKQVKSNKKFLEKMTEKLKEYHLSEEIKDDLSYYDQEILYYGICNKELLEECFLNAYVNMYDYWLDLDYQQRKHQVNVDLRPYLDQMTSFVYGENQIYLPMFDERMNLIYENEMVLFALKQYQKLKHEFQTYVRKDLYGHLPYQSNFCSGELLLDDHDLWVIYESKTTTLYLLKEHSIIETICIHPIEPVTNEILLALVNDFQENDDISFLTHLISYHLCDRRMEKKLIKLLKKKQKKLEKISKNKC